jgi:hypothetical protein
MYGGRGMCGRSRYLYQLLYRIRKIQSILSILLSLSSPAIFMACSIMVGLSIVWYLAQYLGIVEH